MSRVDITFDGNSRGAVGAARQTVEAIDKVKRTAADQAQQGIQRRVEERRSLQALAVEYTKVATTAKKGSEQQIAALKLEQKALRELNDTHGVHSTRLRSSTNELGKFSRGSLAGSGAVGHLGRSVAFASGAFLSGVGLIAVLKESTTAAGSLEVQLQRTDKTFGGNADTIKKWSESSAKSLGVTRAAALDAVNTVGTLLTNMGVAAGQVAKLSPTLLQRAADVASAKGVSSDTVNTAFIAGIAGRTRALKQLGIVIDATTIKEEAEREGLVRNVVDAGKVAVATEQVRIAEYKLGVAIEKHGAQSVEAAQASDTLSRAKDAAKKASAGHAEALTNEQKALATYGAIMSQTANLQGNFAKHSGNLAEQTKILHAEIGNVEETLGRGLIPQLEHYLPILTNWIDRNEKNGTFQRDFNKAIKAGSIVVDGAVGTVKGAVHVYRLFSDAVGGDTQALEILAGFILGRKFISAIASLKADVAAIGITAGETGAAGKVGLLRSRLTGLGAISIAPIIIPIALAISAKEKSFIEKHFGKAGAAIFDAIGTAAGGGIIGGPGAVYNDLFGGGSGSKTKTTTQTQTNTNATGPGSETLNWSGDYAGLDAGFKSKLEQCVADAGGSSINVTSGRRSASHNAAVGGAQNSNHLTGHAADGQCLINGRWYPLGQAPMNYSKFGLRAGATFDWGGSPDIYHVDDGSNVGGAAATLPTVATSTPTTDTTTGTGGFVEKPKPKVAGVIAGFALIPAAIRTALLGDKTGSDKDLADLKKAREALIDLQATASKKEQAPIADELARIGKQIKAINFANANAGYKQHAKDAAAALKNVDAAWSKHLKILNDAAAAEKKAFDQTLSLDMSHILRGFDRQFSAVKTAFDKATSAGLAALAAPTIAATVQTPQEKALADFIAGRTATTDSAAATQRQSDLAAAISGGDPAAIAAAQDAINQAALDEQQKGLQDAADASRVAADQATVDAQKAADDKAAVAQQAYQDQRDAQWQALQDINDDQRIALQQSLDDWTTNLDDKKAAWTDFIKWMADNGLSTTGLLDPGATPAGDAAAAAASGLYGGAIGTTLQTIHEAAVAGAITAAQASYLTSGHKLQIPGFASGGWAGSAPPRIDPRDTIPALLRKGEYVMSPEEVAAGGPRWGRGSGGGGDINVTVTFSGGTFIGSRPQQVASELSPHIANAIERHIGYSSPRG